MQARIQLKRRGLLFVLSSPSGAGKSTIARMLLERDNGISLSVSATTRPKRDGEVEGTVLERPRLRRVADVELMPRRGAEPLRARAVAAIEPARLVGHEVDDHVGPRQRLAPSAHVEHAGIRRQ